MLEIVGRNKEIDSLGYEEKVERATAIKEEGVQKFKEGNYKEAKEKFEEAEKYYKDTLSLKKSPVTNLNRIFHSKFNDEDPCSSYYFEHCGGSPNGNSSGESCTWIRPYSLLFDDWPRCKMQVVGHTEVGEKYFSYNNKKLMILDSHGHNLFKIIDTEKLNELKFNYKKCYIKIL